MTMTRTRPARPNQAGSSPGGHREVTVSPPWDRRRIDLTVATAILGTIALWAIWRTEVWDVAAIFGEGREKMGAFLFGTDIRDGALPPRFDELGEITSQVIETFFMAVAGTALAAAISLPLAFVAARNTTPHPVLRMLARGLIAFSRTVPDIIFAFIFVRVYRIGPLPGILALGFHAIGMVGKLMADAIEESDPGQREAIAAQGGSWLQQMATGVLPQVVPSFLATVLFRLDINFRSSTVLGLVGAGGIGQLFNQYTGNLRWNLAMGVVVAIMVTVLLVELGSTMARKALLGGESANEPGTVAKWVEAITGRSRVDHLDLTVLEEGDRSTTTGRAVTFDRETLRPPIDAYRAKLAVFTVVGAALVVASYFVTQISLQDFFYGLRPEFGSPPRGELPSVWNIAQRLIPIDFDPFSIRTDWWTPVLRSALFDTIATGFAATALGIPLALPIAYLAARNVAPNRYVFGAARFLLVLIRAVPELVIAIILVVGLGLGLIPGVIALITGVIGFGGKLFADAIEEVDIAPRQGVVATGASRLQEALTGVTPQFMPALVGQGLYLLDIMIRSSTVLGIVGAGGVGALLSNFLQGQRFEEAGGILFAVFVVVFLIERLSDWFRVRLI